MAIESWVIVRRETGQAILETFNPKLFSAINRERYDVVPILDWLVGLNRRIQAARDAAPVDLKRKPLKS